MESKWYAVFLAQGKEFYVKDKLDNLINLDGHLDEVLLPVTKEIFEVRRKKLVRSIPVYPCYLFIKTNLTREVQNAVCEVSYVLRILGEHNTPRPIADDEMEIVQALSSDSKIRSAFTYKIGDVVEILGGHCKGLSGRVIDILDVNTLKLEIQIFNRAIYSTVKLEDAKVA
ncbi:MAG: transcription termination/antitermination NusG family protein [Nitrosarchaeum sp.]|nr:transcription termination/antitermination NusG family protein [Nitrosarchaeum sp.]